MHGGFENETPNIPTNSIMKIDLVQLFKNSPALLQKLEPIYPGGRPPSSKGDGKNTPGSSKDGSTSPTDPSSRATTPPFTGTAKENGGIRMGKVTIEPTPGEKVKQFSMNELEDAK
jgi:hypothetical protein